MAYFEDEVPKELELNGEYTSREIYLFMIENRNVLILSESVHLNHRDDGFKYKIVDIKDKYIHKQAENSYNTHLLPNTRTKVIEITKI